MLTPEQVHGLDVHGDTESAVLVPLFADGAGELHAVFTRRRDDLRRHPGEISFPGGRRAPVDQGHLSSSSSRGLNTIPVRTLGKK